MITEYQGWFHLSRMPKAQPKVARPLQVKTALIHKRVDLTHPCYRRAEKDGRKCHLIIMAEVSQLENGRGEELPTIRLCAVLYQDGAIIEMGSTEIVDYRGRFIGNMARIKIETSTDVSVSSIKLYIKAD